MRIRYCLKCSLFVAILALMFVSTAPQVFAHPAGPDHPPGPHQVGPPLPPHPGPGHIGPPPPPPPGRRGHCVERCSDHFRDAIRECRTHSRRGYHRSCERQAKYQERRCMNRCRYR